jgi:hypothetical protein
MKPWTAIALLAAGLLAGCMANGPATTAQPSHPAGEPAPAGPGPSPSRASGAGLPAPLILDRADLRLGVTVQFSRIPTLAEINDLRQSAGLAHVILALPAWPADYETLMGLGQLPPETDAIVVLSGYPPSREAAEAWNLVQARLRIVLLVDGPPPSATVVADLNAMRGLERVIAQIDPPSRAGFERLQRPLSFRKVVE